MKADTNISREATHGISRPALFYTYVRYCNCSKHVQVCVVALVNFRFSKQPCIYKRVDIFDRHKANVIPRGIAK